MMCLVSALIMYTPLSCQVRYSAVVNRTHVRMILFRSALAIASGFKQVMTSLVLLSFATQLSRKEGITIPKPEYREYWDNTMVLLNENSEFILATHSETNWKIDVWKTGGLLYFSPASTSPDMTDIVQISTRYSFGLKTSPPSLFLC